MQEDEEEEEEAEPKAQGMIMSRKNIIKEVYVI